MNSSAKSVKAVRHGFPCLDRSAATNNRANGCAHRNSHRVFEKVIDCIEPENENLTRKLWNPADYIDNHFFQEGMVPMTLGYADYLIHAFLWHHVVDLAVIADRLAEAAN